MRYERSHTKKGPGRVHDYRYSTKDRKVERRKRVLKHVGVDGRPCAVRVKHPALYLNGCPAKWAAEAGIKQAKEALNGSVK